MIYDDCFPNPESIRFEIGLLSHAWDMAQDQSRMKELLSSYRILRDTKRQSSFRGTFASVQHRQLTKFWLHRRPKREPALVKLSDVLRT